MFFGLKVQLSRHPLLVLKLFPAIFNVYQCLTFKNYVIIQIHPLDKKTISSVPTIIKKEISFDRNSFINLILLSTLPLSMPKNNFIPTFQILCYSKIVLSSFQLHSKDFSWDQEAIDLRHKSARNLNKSENQWLCFYVQVKMLNVLFQSLYFIECIYAHTHGNVTMSWFHSLLFWQKVHVD